MSSSSTAGDSASQVELELYFIIAKFLGAGPCQGASKVLLEELEHHQLLPKRIDWEGREHFRSYDNLVSLYRHIRNDHLLKICQRIGPLLEKEVKPSVGGVLSVLGAGSQSVLRTIDDVKRIHWKPEIHTALRHNRPLKPPANLAHPPNIVHISDSRSLTGQQRNDHALPCKLYSHMVRLFRSLGHLSAVYCLCFDRTGEYFFTGADDHLIKVWSTHSGRLLSTLRGHSAEITDMAVNYENTLLAAGSCDKLIRVWCLRSMAPVAVLHSHSGMITSLQFCPYQRGNLRYLASTGGDGCVCFWKWHLGSNKFDPKPVKFIERSRAGAQMLCSSFSPGGAFLATGSSDQVIRVYSLFGAQIEKICELESHMDRVDTIQYSGSDTRFISGSKDGFARIWRFERQEWRCLVLDVSDKIKPIGVVPPVTNGEIKSTEKLRVTMVCWNADDTRTVTAVSDCSLKVWDSHTGQLLQVLQSHQDEVFVLEHCPTDPRIILSAGHDGHILLWDIYTGTVIKKYFNNIQGQGHGAVFDCKWAPDGQSFSTTDSHGFLMYFGFGSNERYQVLPEEMFFHTDYRPLIRDANNYVLDEQTQQPPHLMPPPFLVDIDGNPHSPRYQKLVPGREKCTDMQLVPQLGVLPNGDREVLDDVLEVVQAIEQQEPEPELEPPQQEFEYDENGDIRIIDRLIERLQQEQDERIAAAGGEPLRVSGSDQGDPTEDQLQSPRVREGPLSPLSPLSPPPIRGPRRSGETEGVRQARGHVPVSRRATPRDIANWSRRVVVRELDHAMLRTSAKVRFNIAEEETKAFVHERKRKPLPSENDSSDSCIQMKMRHKKKVRNTGHRQEERSVNRLTTRALYDTEEEEEETPGGTTEEQEDGEEEVIQIDDSDHMWKSSSDGDSSDYSDWMEDTAHNLQPPQRRSARQPKRRHFSSEDSEEDDHKTDTEEEEEDEAEHQESNQPSGSRHSNKSKKKQVVKKAPSRQSKRERKQQQKKQKLLHQQGQITELPDAFKPPEWLTETVPRKSPYFPQIGDEVMYFRQGHELYLKAVKLRKAYDVDITRNQPWHKIPQLREQELVKVIGLKYEVKPPRLVCLKLAMLDNETGHLEPGRFTVKYHDMPDVIDFIVLKQTFDIAMRRKWKVGDHFRSLIDDAWWFGQIEAHTTYDELYPDSQFQCFTVHWANGEVEKMSPWDLEPCSEGRVPRNRDASIPVTQTERKGMLYSPHDSDWPEAGREAECRRISQALDIVMELSIAEHFLAPVDLNAFPLYAMIIAYPVDLSLVKERLEKHFYRRGSSIQFDIRHIESNAIVFNEPKSRIVKLAKQVTELCLRVIRDYECFDPMPLYNEITKDAEFALGPARSVRKRELESNPSGEDEEEAAGPSSSRPSRNASKRRRVEVRIDPNAWKAQCRQLLDIIFDCEDSAVFRNPVDPVNYPDYYDIIDMPMDLGTIKEHVQCDDYETPHQFCKDVRLVFNNSKSYNTNKRSRIYAMTLRLSAMFEDQIKDIINSWKSSMKLRRTNRRAIKGSSKAHGASFKSPISPGPSSASTSTPGSTSRPNSTLRIHSSGVSSSGMSSGPSRPRGSRSLSKHHERAARVASRRILADSDQDDEDAEGTPAPSRWSTRRVLKRKAIQSDADEEEEEEEGEEEEERQEPPHKDGEYDSDYQVERKRVRSKPTPKKKISPKPNKSKKKLVNGNGQRYSTRCSTGSIQRKNYDRVFSSELTEHHQSESDQDESATSDSEPDGKISKHSSPSRKARTRPPPKGKSQRRRVRCAPRDSDDEDDDDNDDDDNDDDKAGSGSDHSDSDSDVCVRKSRIRGLHKKHNESENSDTEKETSAKGNDSENDSEDEQQNKNVSSSDNSDSAEEKSKSDSDTEEYCEEDVAPRKTRSVTRRTTSSRTPAPRSRPSMDDDFVYDRLSASRYSTRNRGQRTVLYREDESEDNDANSDSDHERTSVSSRGRVRKPSARARAIFS